ncbi:hypothetical protein H8959_017385 [Pygathrix nigripes]
MLSRVGAGFFRLLPPLSTTKTPPGPASRHLPAPWDGEGVRKLPSSVLSRSPTVPATDRKAASSRSSYKVKNQQTSTVVTFQTCRLLLEVPPRSGKPTSNRDGCRLGSRDARQVGLELPGKGQGAGRNHCSRSWRRVGTSDCGKWERRGFGEETRVEHIAHLSVTSAGVESVFGVRVEEQNQVEETSLSSG